MQNNDLTNYLKTNVILKRKFNFNLNEIENLIPWERDIYIDIIKQQIEEENEKNGNK